MRLTRWQTSSCQSCGSRFQRINWRGPTARKGTRTLVEFNIQHAVANRDRLANRRLGSPLPEPQYRTWIRRRLSIRRNRTIGHSGEPRSIPNERHATVPVRFQVRWPVIISPIPGGPRPDFVSPLNIERRQIFPIRADSQVHQVIQFAGSHLLRGRLTRRKTPMQQRSILGGRDQLQQERVEREGSTPPTVSSNAMVRLKCKLAEIGKTSIRQSLQLLFAGALVSVCN